MIKRKVQSQVKYWIKFALAKKLSKALVFQLCVLCCSPNAFANSDYREFLACVDEILDNNPGMNPKVAEDICSDIIDKKEEDLGSTNYCDRLLKK